MRSCRPAGGAHPCPAAPTFHLTQRIRDLKLLLTAILLWPRPLTQTTIGPSSSQPRSLHAPADPGLGRGRGAAQKGPPCGRTTCSIKTRRVVCAVCGLRTCAK